MPSEKEIFDALRRYWGYDAFRPMQQKIVTSLLAGRDTCVVMPTGGGKSLCYQLPAAMRHNQTVVVISPLIALMQDQMAQLTQMGISAGTINSSVSADEQSAIMRQAVSGKFRLLYLSPERLARADTVSWLKQIPVSLFAIDEAHCISEWGHEFRPEYRQLSSLRQHFTDCPIAAFTASATRQVRHDIVEQLRLRQPDKYIASFHRPNLRYVIEECESGTQFDLLMRALKKYRGSNVIVYAPTIKKTEDTAEAIRNAGISAIAYHGKMAAEERKRNQECWTSDEVRVLVGTIAFGLGINKPSVRAVIHLSLPKSIEQYYQEAGRAGRDGKSADCVLLWQRRDIGLLTYFINQISDPAEKERSWQRYHEVLHFVQDKVCRHRRVCLHFGETPKWQTCESCDVCGVRPEWLLRSGSDRPSRKRRSATDKAEPAAESPSDLYAGPSELPSAVDDELREYLREWRRNTAREQGIAAFIVMHDSSLDEICRVRPKSLAAIRAISGFGEKKTAIFGPGILEALARFSQGARPAEVKKKIALARG